jgi:hypothetical protein
MTILKVDEIDMGRNNNAQINESGCSSRSSSFTRIQVSLKQDVKVVNFDEDS